MGDEPETFHPSLDDRCIGGGGEVGTWTQFLQVVLVSFAWVFDAQQAFISIFTDTKPAFAKADCHELPRRNSWAWDYTSVVSEWSLDYSCSIIAGLPASSFFVGCLAGGLLLATLADSSLGRKNSLLLSCLLMSVAGLFTALLSTNIWIYSAFRFLSGFGRGTIGTCALVLSSELVGKRWRAQVGIIGFFCFTLGFLSLPPIAYFNRASSWRVLYLWTCIPALFYCVLLHFFVRESPRWLFLQRGFLDKQRTPVDLYSAVNMFLDKSWALRRLATVMAVGFGIGMVYYGMPLGVGNLAFNLYLSVTLNALSELPASLVTFFLIGRLNRKSVLLGFTILSGSCSLMCVVTRGQIQMLMELVSFFSACTAFNVLLIYSLELFPTCVRNSAVSMVRQVLLLGAVFSPVLVAAGKLLSYSVFGLTIGFCGMFVAFLPETKGRTLCDTMDEEETATATPTLDNNNSGAHVV